ncbi:hypothetical protein GCM10009080_56480 [Cupriavidus pauculus]|nr:hypothetical protein [Cupriavidus pauculus]
MGVQFTSGVKTVENHETWLALITLAYHVMGIIHYTMSMLAKS